MTDVRKSFIRDDSKQLAAVDIQRRLELKEFFLSKNDTISAALVDNMFDIAGFQGVKEQVLRMYDQLPENWITKDRYEKYKKLLKQGVTPTKIRQEMAKDGIDPEEFAWDDDATREARIRLTQSGCGKATLKRGPKARHSNFRKKRTRKSNKRKGSLVDLGMDEYELQSDLGRMRLQSTTSGSSEDANTGIKKRGPFKGLRTQMTKKRRPKSSQRAKFESSSRRSVSEVDVESLADVSLESIEVIEMTEEDYKEKFTYRKTDVEEEGQRERSTSVYSTLTKKNKIGDLHDYVPFFTKKPDTMLRKGSVGNIKRRMTRMSQKRSSRRSTYGNIFYEDDGKDLKVEPEESQPKARLVRKPAPKAAPRKRRTRATHVLNKDL